MAKGQQWPPQDAYQGQIQTSGTEVTSDPFGQTKGATAGPFSVGSFTRGVGKSASGKNLWIAAIVAGALCLVVSRTMYVMLGSSEWTIILRVLCGAGVVLLPAGIAGIRPRAGFVAFVVYLTLILLGVGVLVTELVGHRLFYMLHGYFISVAVQCAVIVVGMVMTWSSADGLRRLCRGVGVLAAVGCAIATLLHIWVIVAYMTDTAMPVDVSIFFVLGSYDSYSATGDAAGLFATLAALWPISHIVPRNAK